MKKINVVLAATIAMTSVAPAMTSYADMEYVKRFSGNDRIKTAIEVSKGNFSANTTNLILVNGSNPADALSGGPLAWKLKAPILLVGKNSVTNETLAEIKRLNPKNVYILGGVNSISATIEKIAKANAPSVNIKRIAGNDRYETSTKVAEEIVGSSKTNGAGFVNGKTAKFPDALSAAALVGSKGMPLILTNGSTLPKGTEGYKGNSKNYIVGGTNSISIYGLKGKRLSGNDRFATSAAVATEGFKDAMQEYSSSTGNAKYNNCVVVDGTNYPDALTAISVARKYNAPILLTNKNSVPSPIIRYMNDQGRDKAFIIGGLNSVSAGVANVIKSRMEANYKINSSNEIAKKKAVIKGLLSDLNNNEKLLDLLKGEGSGVKSEKAKYKKLIDDYKKKYANSKPEDLKNVSLETMEAGRKAVGKAFDKIMDVKDDCFRTALLEQKNNALEKMLDKEITEDSKKKLKALIDDANDIIDKSGKNKEKLELALKLKEFKVREESGESSSTSNKTDSELIANANKLLKEINKDKDEKKNKYISQKVDKIDGLCNSLNNLDEDDKKDARKDLEKEYDSLKAVMKEYRELGQRIKDSDKYLEDKKNVLDDELKFVGILKTTEGPMAQLKEIRATLKNSLSEAENKQKEFDKISVLEDENRLLRKNKENYENAIDNYKEILNFDEDVVDNDKDVEKKYKNKESLKEAYENYQKELTTVKNYTVDMKEEMSSLDFSSFKEAYNDAYDNFIDVYNDKR